MPWSSNIANKFAKTAKPFGTRVPLTLRYALAIPSVSRSVGLTFLTSPATGTKITGEKPVIFLPWHSNIANKFAKTAKPFGTRVPLTLRYALAIPSVGRSVGLTFLTSPATGTKITGERPVIFFAVADENP